MNTLLILAAFVAVSLAMPAFPNPEYDEFWGTFKSHHAKQYGEAEDKMRRFIWEKNFRYIVNHNYEADLGHHTFRLGMNEHGDLSDEEYAKFMTGYRMPENTTSDSPIFLAPENMVTPQMVDWRKEGYVTPVKNQKRCGSCWAFSTTGSLEGQHFRKSKKLVSLSEQNLVDCSMKFGNHGCMGGLMDNAFRYIKANGGIDTEKSYPYMAKNGKCHYTKMDSGATDTGFVDIPRGKEEELMKAVAAIGPISVAIDAHTTKFRFYKTGVYVDTECSSVKLDHGVLAVGYGMENNMDYWLVKNSWGTTYGDMGYIKMARNHNNMCGIATQASYPLV